MKRVRNFHRKRPHILPPLPNLGPSVLRPMDPLQPPDLLLTKNRLGSPAPRRTVPVEPDDIFTTSDGKPIITIFEPSLKETEKCNIKIDLLSDGILEEGSNFPHPIKKTNFFENDGKGYDAENPLMRNFSKKDQFDFLCDVKDKKLKTQEILPLDRNENLKAFESKVLQIPNRYKLLKPIGQKNES